MKIDEEMDVEADGGRGTNMEISIEEVDEGNDQQRDELIEERRFFVQVEDEELMEARSKFNVVREGKRSSEVLGL